MAFDQLLLRENEFAVQPEATYGTSPGALAGTDFFKHTSSLGISPNVERYFRDRDRDNGQASVVSVQPGRESCGIAWDADLIPAGVTGAPTAPDMDELIKACFGTKHAATAHTTTAAGSSGVTLNLASGGGAASGLAIGDLFAVDVDGTGAYEVRQVAGISGDVVTTDRAFSTNPAASRAVKVGVTYKLLNTAVLTVYAWLFNGNNLRYVLPGICVSEMDIAMNFAEGAPIAKVKLSGMGQRLRPQTSTSRPTPSTAGLPLLPSVGKAWISTTRYSVVNCGLNVKNGITLRNNQSSQLYPSGAKRTDNNSRYDINQTLELLLSDTLDTIYQNARTLTQQDVIVQLGNSVGNIVAWRTPNFRPDGEFTEIEGEVGVKLSGRCLGTVGDDDVYLAFI